MLDTRSTAKRFERWAKSKGCPPAPPLRRFRNPRFKSIENRVREDLRKCGYHVAVQRCTVTFYEPITADTVLWLIDKIPYLDLFIIRFTPPSYE